MYTAALIANGEIPLSTTLRPLIVQHDRMIAIDGGLLHCHHLGLRPHQLVGDFDSCPPELLQQYADVPRIALPTHKDETDLEVAMGEEAKRGATRISLFGAWGRRMDHSIGNLFLLSRFPQVAFLETETETVFVIHKSAHLSVRIGQTLSLFPFNGPATGIHTQGLKWELRGGNMDHHFFGVSNICLQETVDIRIEQGSLLCCLVKTEREK